MHELVQVILSNGHPVISCNSFYRQGVLKMAHGKTKYHFNGSPDNVFLIARMCHRIVEFMQTLKMFSTAYELVQSQAYAAARATVSDHHLPPDNVVASVQHAPLHRDLVTKEGRQLSDAQYPTWQASQ